MSLVSAAQEQFLGLLQTLDNGRGDRNTFLAWIRDTVLPETNGNPNHASVVSGRMLLSKISVHLRSVVPLEAVLPSEKIVYPTAGADADVNATNSVHLDAFLYDEEEEEQLVQEGKLSRSFCKRCGSKETEPLTFVTHSCSKERLEFIFTTLLPPLDGKRVLDVGCRLGAVLYGAYAFSSAAHITGIEINADFVDLCSQTIAQFGMGDRVAVAAREMTTVPEVVAAADVIILNNVFDWFMVPEEQVRMWHFLAKNVRSGALLVTIPSIEQTWQHIKTGISLSDWLVPLNAARPENSSQMEAECEVTEVKLYQVARQIM